MDGVERKVRALLSKTVERGCTAGEHIAALEMARRIVRQRGLNESWFTWPNPPAGYRREGDEIVIDNQYREPRKGTKEQTLIDLMSKPGGATISELMEATGWQAHSVRGVISTLRKKRGLNIRNRRSYQYAGREARYWVDTGR